MWSHTHEKKITIAFITKVEIKKSKMKKRKTPGEMNKNRASMSCGTTKSPNTFMIRIPEGRGWEESTKLF